MKKKLIIFAIGAIGYGLVEILWRRFTHWSMILAGGVCFSLFYKLCEDEKDMPVFKKCIIGATLITSVELIFGTFVNVILKWNVWDYSKLPLNFYGQVCLPYSVLWFFLCIPLVALCKKIRKMQ